MQSRSCQQAYHLKIKMLGRTYITSALFTRMFSGSGYKPTDTSSLTPPVAEKVPRTETNHDDTLVDNYYWMRLTDEQKAAASPDEQTQKVVAYLNSENAYTKGKLAHTEELQQ